MARAQRTPRSSSSPISQHHHLQYPFSVQGLTLLGDAVSVGLELRDHMGCGPPHSDAGIEQAALHHVLDGGMRPGRLHGTFHFVAPPLVNSREHCSKGSSPFESGTSWIACAFKLFDAAQALLERRSKKPLQADRLAFRNSKRPNR